MTQKLLHYTKGLKLLYVEDDPAAQTKFKEVFAILFSEVWAADNGAQGVELYQKHQPDIVITDIQMPLMDGLSMTRALRKISSDLPVILVTGHVEAELFLESIEIGVDAYLRKPLEQSQLFKTLLRVCQNLVALKKRKEENRYFTIITQSSLVCKFDPQGQITYANEKLSEATGYPADALIDTPFTDLVTDEKLYSMMWQMVRDQKIWRGRVTTVTKQGSALVLDMMAIAADETKEEVMTIGHDVTPMVALEAELEKERQKREIENAKEHFLVLFTHELKTPLNAIINFTKYLKGKSDTNQEVPPAKVTTLLGSILNNANTMLNQVSEILELSRIKSGKNSYERNTFALRSVVEELINGMQELIRHHNSEVTLSITPDTLIHSNQDYLKQILKHIFSNALIYGREKVVIAAEENERGITLCIEDDGPGIMNKEEVFNLYSHDNDELLHHGKEGIGLGLYFVRLLCQKLGIEYGIEKSPLLGGTRFLLQFKH